MTLFYLLLMVHTAWNLPSRIQHAEESKEIEITHSTLCKPNSYVIVDCNVCRCNSRGEVSRCTLNDCSKRSRLTASTSREALGSAGHHLHRGIFNSEHATCIPNSWYELSPCQFCYCQHARRLVCSTRSQQDVVTLKLRPYSYNLTQCGVHFPKELLQLSRLNMSNLEYDTSMMSPTIQIVTTTGHPLTTDLPAQELYWGAKGQFDYDFTNDNSYEDEDPASEIRSVPALASFEKIARTKDSNESDSPESIRMEIPVQIVTTKSPTFLNALKSLESMQEMSQTQEPRMEQLSTEEPRVKESDEKGLLLEPPASSEKSPVISETKQRVSRINIPSVVDRIIRLALRKSMVEVVNESHCVPGTTKKRDCNFCYCLNNGKLLCTDKKTC